MIAKFKQLSEQAKSLKEATRYLNMACSELNGVAATIPKDAAYPLSRFRGCKILLQNVIYDPVMMSIRAAIKLPPTKEGKILKGISLSVFSHQITEDWFKDEKANS